MTLIFFLSIFNQ